MSAEERQQLADQLRSAERAAHAPWVRGDRPAWTAVLIGALAGAWVLANGVLDAPYWIVGHVALTLAVLGVWFRYWRATGAFPTGRMPREIVGPMYLALFGGAAIGLGAWAVAVLVSVWVAAPVAALAGAGLFVVFDRRYAAASRRMVARTQDGDDAR